MPVERDSLRRMVSNKQRTFPLKGTSKTKPELPCHDLHEKQGSWPFWALFEETYLASMRLPTPAFVQVLHHDSRGKTV